MILILFWLYLPSGETGITIHQYDGGKTIDALVDEGD